MPKNKTPQKILTSIEQESLHPLWPAFVNWVEHGGVVRTDLINTRYKENWVIIWDTFRAGAIASGWSPKEVYNGGGLF